MAASSFETWTVIIVAEEGDLHRVLRMPPNSTIQDVKIRWLEAVGRVHDCGFSSAITETLYANFMTLEMIGETLPNSHIVTLRVQIFDGTTPAATWTLFVIFGGNCEEISVTPNDILGNVLRCLPCRNFEHNGRLLNLNDTVGQAGLIDNAVIVESRQKVTIRLTGGQVRSFFMPADALVSQLKLQLSPFEEGEFSLWYSERELMPNDLVVGLNQIVEVLRTRFTVFLRERTVTWRTSSGMIKFGEFITQLSSRCDMPEQQLEALTYACVRCNRRVSKVEEDFQVIQVKCCREESLTLRAEIPTVTRG